MTVEIENKRGWSKRRMERKSREAIAYDMAKHEFSACMVIGSIFMVPIVALVSQIWR